MEDVEAIVRGLSPADKGALIDAERDGNLGRYFTRFIARHVGKRLVRLGLGTAVWSGVMLSTTGEAVRTYLLSQTKE